MSDTKLDGSETGIGRIFIKEIGTDALKGTLARRTTLFDYPLCLCKFAVIGDEVLQHGDDEAFGIIFWVGGRTGIFTGEDFAIGGQIPVEVCRDFDG